MLACPRHSARGSLLLCLAILGCGGQTRPSAGAESSVPPGVSMVSSSVVVEACPDSPKMNSKQAAREIEELVGPCTKVPGGAAHFSATLLPGGQVELASPSGDPKEGVIPTCLVQTVGQLRHKVKLTSPCKFDVKLEERAAGN